MLMSPRLLIAVLALTVHPAGAFAGKSDEAAIRAQLALARPSWTGGRVPRAGLPPHSEMRVQADVVRVRAAPSGEANAVANLPIGKLVYVLDARPAETGWVEIFVAADDKQAFSHQRGFVQAKFLIADRGFAGRFIDRVRPEDMSELAFAERLYAFEPSPENIQRLIGAVALTGDLNRVSQLEKLKSYREGHHLAQCVDGKLRWLLGGPYSEDLWRGNARNLKGIEVLETFSRAMQSYPWFTSEPSTAAKPRPFQANRSVEWPWLMPVTTVRAEHGLISELDTREACIGKDGKLVATFPTTEINQRVLRMGDDGFGKAVDAAQSSLPLLYGGDSAKVPPIDWLYVNMIDPELRYAFVTGDLQGTADKVGAKFNTLDLGILIDIATGRSVDSFGALDPRLDRQGIHVSNFKAFKLSGSGDTLFLVTEKSAYFGQPRGRDRAVFLGRDPRRVVFPLDPAAQVSDELESKFNTERSQNRKPASGSLTAASLSLRYFRPTRAPARGESPAALFSTLEYEDAVYEQNGPDGFGDWTHVADVELSEVGLRKAKVLEGDSGRRLDVYFEGTNRLGDPLGSWIKLRVRKSGGDEQAINVIPSIAAVGQTERILATHDYYKGANTLLVYETDLDATGEHTILRLTPNGMPPVWIRPFDQEVVDLTLRSKADIIASATELLMLHDKPAILRAAPQDAAAIVRSAVIEKHAAAGQQAYTHLEPKEVQGDWTKVGRTAGGDGDDYYCPGDAELEGTEGWLRWRRQTGEVAISWIDFMSC